MNARRSPTKRPQSRLGLHESLPHSMWEFLAWCMQRPERVVILMFLIAFLTFLAILLTHLASGVVIGMATRYVS